MSDAEFFYISDSQVGHFCPQGHLAVTGDILPVRSRKRPRKESPSQGRAGVAKVHTVFSTQMTLMPVVPG